MTVTPIFERQPRLVLRISGFNRVRDHLNQDCFCVGDDLKVHHVIHMLRSLHIVGQLIDAVIVTSDEGTYLGLVPLSALAVAAPTLPILTLAQGSQFLFHPRLRLIKRRCVCAKVRGRCCQCWMRSTALSECWKAARL
ncbi:CBS domain-containing protein [Vibrio fluvialis]|uniref:hypothetical protein n=1 Tax=Vibrio fluvialis TaxID=676 RepID=UPI0028F71867|nr:hypothetical protein [Vibrio fluvialis]